MLSTLQSVQQQVCQQVQKSSYGFMNCYFEFILRDNDPNEKARSFSSPGEIMEDSMNDIDDIVIFSGINALGFMFGLDLSTDQFVVSYKDMAGTVYDGRTDFTAELKDINPIFNNWEEYDNKLLQEVKIWFNYEDETGRPPSAKPDIHISATFDR